MEQDQSDELFNLCIVCKLHCDQLDHIITTKTNIDYTMLIYFVLLIKCSRKELWGLATVTPIIWTNDSISVSLLSVNLSGH